MAVVRLFRDGYVDRPVWAGLAADTLPTKTSHPELKQGDRFYVEDGAHTLWFDGTNWRYTVPAPSGKTPGAVVS